MRCPSGGRTFGTRISASRDASERAGQAAGIVWYTAFKHARIGAENHRIVMAVALGEEPGKYPKGKLSSHSYMLAYTLTNIMAW